MQREFGADFEIGDIVEAEVTPRKIRPILQPQDSQAGYYAAYQGKQKERIIYEGVSNLPRRYCQTA